MLISAKQNYRFWTEWNALCKAKSWSKEHAELQRKAMLDRAGFSSLKHVTAFEGFTKVLHELAALKDDLGGVLYADRNEQRTLIWSITQLAKKVSQTEVATVPFRSPYVAAIMRERFGHLEVERLSLDELRQLRDTVADRGVQEHRPETLERRNAKARARRAEREGIPVERMPF